MNGFSKIESLKRYYDISYFNESQLNVIMTGMDFIFPITLYANPTYDVKLIRNIIMCLVRMCEKADINCIADEYQVLDWHEVKDCLEHYDGLIRLLNTVGLTADKVDLFAAKHDIGVLWF